MKLITAYGPSIFPDQAEMATMPVPHQHLPSREMRNQTTKHAMTSTSQVLLDLSADSHINATSASGWSQPARVLKTAIFRNTLTGSNSKIHHSDQ